jgi:hypothetical protein
MESALNARSETGVLTERFIFWYNNLVIEWLTQGGNK